MKANWKSISILLLALAPLLLFAFLLAKYGVNVPHWDDHAIRIFVDNFDKSTSFSDRFVSIFTYHNEHRIGLTRLFALAVYNFQGHLDFKTLQIIGFVGLVGLWWILTIIATKLKSPLWLYFIISLCVFNFGLYENMLWGMASVQNFWVPFLAFATFYHLSFTLNRAYFSFSLAMVFSTIAIFTSGNGVMVPVIGMVLLLIQKKWKWSGIWAFISIFFLVLYFQGYSNIPSKRWVIEIETVKAFFSSIASFIYADNEFGGLNHSGLALLEGFIFIMSLITFGISALVWFQKSKRLQNSQALFFLIGAALFCFGTLAIVSLTRSDEGIGLILSGKYKIYSFLTLALVIMYSVRLFRKHLQFKIAGIATIGVLVVWGISYIGYFKYFEKSKLEGLTFALDNYRQVEMAKTSYSPPEKLTNLTLNFDESVEDPQHLDSLKVWEDRIDVWEFNPNQQTEFTVFKSDSAVYFAGMESLPSVNPLKRYWDYFENRKQGKLNLLGFPSGLYEIYYLYLEEEKLINSGKIIRITGKPYTEAPKNW